MSGDSSTTFPSLTNESSPTHDDLVCEFNLRKAELPVIFFITLVVNIIAFVVLWRMRGTIDSVDHMLVTVLNINDLATTAMFIVSWSIGQASCGHFLDNVICSICGWIGSALMVWSAFIVVIMTGLRCLSLVKPFFYRNHVTPKSVIKAAAGTFIFCLFIFLFPFTGQGKPYRLYTKTLICAFDFSPGGSTVWQRAFVGFVSASGLTTVIFVLICNHLTIRTLRKQNTVHQARVNNTSSTVTNNLHAVTKRRAFQRVTLVLSLVYVVSYAPFGIRLMLDTVNDAHEENDIAQFTTMTLLFLSALLNPLVYGLFNRGFRHELLKMLKCVRTKNKRNKERQQNARVQMSSPATEVVVSSA